MKYMIHGCPSREWYIWEYLMPDMTGQGISESEIILWIDTEGWGNLESFVKSMEWVAANEPPEEGIWHIQDDVLVSDHFAERTKAHDSGVVYGFCNNLFDGEDTNRPGLQKSKYSWHSFQCVRIPNSYAAEFVKWFNDSATQKFHAKTIATGKCDDSLFKEFIHERHFRAMVLNMLPNIVDHIDYLIGGTVINQQREGDQKRPAYYWFEREKTMKLAEKIAERQKKGAKGNAERAKGRTSGRNKSKA